MGFGVLGFGVWGFAFLGFTRGVYLLDWFSLVFLAMILFYMMVVMKVPYVGIYSTPFSLSILINSSMSFVFTPPARAGGSLTFLTWSLPWSRST